MADPYWKYPPGADPRPAFPGYIPPNGASLASHTLYGVNDRIPSDSLQSNSLRSGTYNFADAVATGNRPSSAIGGMPTVAPGVDLLSSRILGSGVLSSVTPGIDRLHVGAGVGTLTSLHDPSLAKRDTSLHNPSLVKQEASLGVTPGVPDKDRSTPLRISESAHGEESNVLYVCGLPSDCTRREVGHLFRPFIGFKEIRLYHKEPRWSGDKARVLCFVEFNDAKCAITALDALQGYKFDERKPDAPKLWIKFAHFPLRFSALESPWVEESSFHNVTAQNIVETGHISSRR